MANTYYDSQLAAEEIEAALEAISGLIVPANNGKVIAINNGKFEARSVQWGGGEPTIEPLSVTANGTYTAPSGVDGYSPVVVNVSGGGGGIEPVANMIDSGYGWKCSDLFFTNTANELLAIINNRRYEKVNGNGAIVMCTGYNGSGTNSCVLLVSTDADAVKYRSYDGSTPAEFNARWSTVVANKTWYVNYANYGWPYIYSPSSGKCLNQLPLLLFGVKGTVSDLEKTELVTKILTAASIMLDAENE